MLAIKPASPPRRDMPVRCALRVGRCILRPRAIALALAFALQPLWAQTASVGMANLLVRGLAQPAGAGVVLPAGGTAVMGQASFDTSKPNALWVTTHNAAGTRQSVINWQSFSIGAGGATYFQQPDAASTSINRVISNTPTLILGTLGSNGKLVLVNQSGIAVGAGAAVDTAGFTASTLQLSDADAAAGRMRFGGPSADTSATPGISVQGQIVARQGDVVLVAPMVSTGERALIQAPNGNTVLAAGRQVEISGRGLEGIALLAQAPSDQVLNLGTLQGNAVGIFAGTLTHSGWIQATQITQDGARVLLKASGDAIVNAKARILATGDVGGNVQVLGQRVALLDQAGIDASGTHGGGTVLVGGDYHGSNPAVSNARMTYVGSDVRITADAIERGAGGKVVVWADEATRMHGIISARGGAAGGAGGFVETSGQQFLDVEGARVLASGAPGTAGTWLLDPNDVEIIHKLNAASDANISPGTPFSPPSNAANSKISDFTLNQALNSSTNVSLSTNNTGSAGTGNIDVDSNAVIQLSTGVGNTSLTLNAHHDIHLQGTIKNSSASNALALNLNADTGSVGGKVEVNSGDNVLFDGGTKGLTVSVLGGNAWTNSGTVTLGSNSTIRLYDGTSVASFSNLAGAVLNDNSSAALSIVSDPTRNGSLSNSGAINAQGGGTWATKFDQSAGAILNVQGGLTLQNLDVAHGTVNIAVGKTLLISDNFGGSDKFQSSTINGPGSLQIGQGASGATPSLTLSSVTSSGLTVLAAGQGTVSFSGTNAFASSNFFNQSSASPNWTVPAATYTGAVQWWTSGALNLAANLQSDGNVTLGAGWNGSLVAPASAAAPGAALNVNQSIKSTAGNVSLQAGDSINVSSNITANGTVELRANNLTLNGTVMTASGNGDAIVLDAGTGHFTNSAGAGALKAPSGRWLVYSNDPASDNRGGLVYDFKQYGTSPGGAILGAGNGFIYTLSPTLNATLSGAANRTYDGSNVVNSLAGLAVTASGAVDGDVATYGYSLTAATYDNRNAGLGKTVTASGTAGPNTVLSSTGKPVYGYTVNPAGASISAAVGNIAPVSLTVSTGNVSKTYDGTTSAAGTPVVTAGSLFGADALTGGSFSFASKNAGTGKSVNVSGVSVSDGNGGANYSVTQAANNTSTIVPASVSLTGARSYDGTAVMGFGQLSLAPTSIIAGDVVSLAGGSAAVASRNVGHYSSLASNALALGGADAANYSVSGASVSLDITQASLTVSTGNVSKTYDGTTSAAGTPVVTAGSLFGADALTGGSFSFASKNAGTGKSVNVSGVSVSDGNGGANYSVTQAANNTSTIVPASVSLTGARSYDGTAVMGFGQLSLAPTSIIAGDVVSLAGGSAAVASRNVGHYSSLASNALALGGADAANYSVSGASVSLDITQASLAVSTGNVSKTYDGTTSALGTPVVSTGALFAGDSLIGGNFAFQDKNVGAGKTVTVSGVGVNDGNGGLNYAVTQLNNAGSSITPASLAAVTGITAANKTADGTTSATLDTSSAGFTGKFAGDALKVATAVGAFADPHVGSGKSVNISGIALGGADAGNYLLLNNSATTTADITLSSGANALLVASNVMAFPDAFAQWLEQQGKSSGKSRSDAKPVEAQLCLP